MSVINVWTSEGEWSTPICGLDKVHLIKAVCRYASVDVDPESYSDSRKLVLDPDIASRTEVNHGGIDYSRIMSRFIDEDTGEVVDTDSEVFSPEDRKDLKDARTFKVPMLILKGLQKNDPALSAKYGEIIDAAKAPASASKDYCLLMKFREE